MSARSTDGFATASLIFGILPMCAGILGIIFGFISLGRIRRSGKGGRGMAIAGILGGFLWAAVVAVAVVIAALNPTRDGDGRVKSTQTIELKELQTGDCVAKEPPSPVKDVTIEPCADGHVGEIFDVSTMPGDSYPGEPAIDSYRTERCRRLLPIYVNATPGRTGFDIFYVAPTKDSWEVGHKTVVCILLAKTGELTGSAKGAGPAPN